MLGSSSILDFGINRGSEVVINYWYSVSLKRKVFDFY